MLAAGGPGDPNLPGWSNVGIASDNNTTCVYLGGSWCITANHVSVSGPVHFGGQLYDVEAGSVHQLHNSDNSLADLKVFRIINPPDLPNILPEYLAPAEPSGQVYMVGDGYTLGAAHYWQVDTGVSPWTWTEQSPPVFPGADDAAGFSVTTHRTLRWGQNTIDQTGLLVQVTGSSYVQGFTTRLDTLKYTGTVAQPHEAQATNGDSGGAVFAYINGHWVLSGIMNAINQPLSGQPSGTTIYGDFTLISDLYKYRDEILSIVTPSVVGRHLFYNNSVFDGIDAAIGPADDAAIAPDKAAYLPGTGTSTFASISSYVRGINGIMVDIAAPTGSLTASDFTFKIGTSTSPETWANAPAPSQVVVRPAPARADRTASRSPGTTTSRTSGCKSSLRGTTPSAASTRTPAWRRRTCFTSAAASATVGPVRRSRRSRTSPTRSAPGSTTTSDFRSTTSTTSTATRR